MKEFILSGTISQAFSLKVKGEEALQKILEALSSLNVKWEHKDVIETEDGKVHNVSINDYELEIEDIEEVEDSEEESEESKKDNEIDKHKKNKKVAAK